MKTILDTVDEDAVMGGVTTLEQDAHAPMVASEGLGDASALPADVKDDTRKVRQLDGHMIYKTVLFMDYRRLRRRFNGIRQPISYKKAIFISLFCVCLALVPFGYFKQEHDKYLFGLEIERGVISYTSSLLFVFASFLLARIQLSIPFKWPVVISYLFMFATLVTMLVLKHVISLGSFVWVSLAVYTVLQITLVVGTKIVIWLGPLLALNGWFFPCTEHLHLFERIKKGSDLNITISRYNDYSIMCGANGCGLCTCIYRVTYRLLAWLIKKVVATDGVTNCKTPFSHQMRYRGEVDENELPHGYGEWLEDDGCGERLQGYWWHGYPIGPFSSQELGSGSIFTNTRVAFITDTRRLSGKVRYGISSTECSISGNFFREFPLTYFFNPLYNDRVTHNTGGLYKRCRFFNVLHDRFADLQGASFKWCVRMLRSQFFLNMPTNASAITVYVDNISKSLRLDGYKRTDGASAVCDEITIKLASHKDDDAIKHPVEVYENSHTHRLYSGLNVENVSGQSTDDGEHNEGNQSKTETEPTELPRMMPKRGLLSAPRSTQGKDGISHLFLDEDDWEDQVNSTVPQMMVKNWAPIRSFGKMGCIADQAVVYIHGYNVTLQEACSQMAHIVAFSKLPPYVLPFVFNWDGQHWGPLGAIAYPKAKNISQHPGLEESFCELLSELLGMGITHLHIIAHSCGARVFFKVFRAAIRKGLVTPILGKDRRTQSAVDDGAKSQNDISVGSIRMDTLLLLNPDFPMEQFRDNDYFVVRSYCDHIVMYADTRDHCLFISQLYNSESSLGMSVFSMCTTPELLDDVIPVLEASGLGLSFDDSDGVTGLSYVSRYTMYKAKITMPRQSHLVGGSFAIDMSTGQVSSKVKRDTMHNSIISPTPANAAFSVSPQSSDGVDSYRLPRLSEDLGVENRHLWLDMDVIDTTMIDTNVDFLKHSLYQMKREIMDDMREVILMKIRADQRQTRLDRRRGNVFVFRVAPAAVNHLFGGR
ncbi:uncharacterized protein BXIN_2241 [Babesia sp. Xinjiang]|uniref:uncharacterized protein n=1 Tax=Babesia sp. Xinjiang TaxID=462227 RepID=UPI000A2415CD|nr:uncharacterized protein BXIN_2241 [Babesia sp. Xinjiang]ORM40829.1 hypothetical protein BXIN_2241 [Babesia sp. Xinjiang]